MGMAGPIPWNRIIEYADATGLDDSLIPLFHGIIRAMDEAYMGWTADAMKVRTTTKPTVKPNG